ncbi:Cell wall biosynthesis/cell cycle regulator smi1 [Schizosaccharomyces pombe]|uniref:Cell wall biosynthesis/cell cycle regulator smi1 n=1 Tax=Schizosaccharomyces pombe (strain 972 / ATCC 24843) TaxID=284812 RepID=SMI1_SCHPO|nr:uncharacterized protein SPBC30D10.17c [Schizosaccharomyces pombe]O14362.1 RecName: Full=Cell wall biosynthesis/cell cycle regulator smi1 [Schizosaccharomyces pombe 972h-]CAB10812.1 cell wall biosynthesis/ cell cycle regulator (predicted) [Schizosaccharomyces pombe]|eukprot:NP_596268.1 uncharacterized protein SPBC30D10.17c [Schizosaccharomyces pombe]
MSKNSFSSMANSVTSFFQSLTTPNRHADPSFRPSRREKQSRLPTPLQSVAASAYSGVNASQTGLLNDSRANSVTNLPNSSNTSQVGLNNISPAPVGYVPGSKTNELANNSMEMQEISPNGSASLPPPVSESWRRIDRWAEENYYELYCQLCYGATVADVDSLEYELECTLPRDVRESLYIHDGQDRGGQPTGILFGVTLLDIEEIEEESELWRRVAQSYAEATLAGKIDQAVASRQASFPPGAVQCVYAHPGWIPLAKDFVGNNIAIDLAPGPAGQWGQVILFGRDQDTKYVVARSWADFLAIVAYDMENGKWLVDEDDNSLRLIYGPPREQWSYLDILKYRARKAERRKFKKRDGKRTTRPIPKSIAKEDVTNSANSTAPSTGTTVLDDGLDNNYEDIPLYGPSKDEELIKKEELEADTDLGLINTSEINQPANLPDEPTAETSNPVSATTVEAVTTTADNKDEEKNDHVTEDVSQNSTIAEASSLQAQEEEKEIETTSVKQE